MSAIWKYPVTAGEFDLEMPEYAHVLSVQVQRGEPVMWAVVDPENKKTRRRFMVHGTGHEFTSYSSRFVGTFQLGPLVFHLFEVR